MSALIGLLLWPAAAEAQLLVVSSTVHEQHSKPGETYTGEIVLRNQGSTPQEVRVYQTDYSFQADGRSEYPDAGSHARSNAPWMRVSPSSLVVPAGETAEISYAVSVPASDTAQPGGTYWSMIMVEPVRYAATGNEEGELGVRSVIRFGVQVATHVNAANASPTVELGTPAVVVAEDGSRVFEFRIRNDSDFGYRPKVVLEVYDAQGSLAVSLEAERGLVYPGTSTMQRFALGPLPAGDYEALVVVDTGAAEMFGGQFKLTINR